MNIIKELILIDDDRDFLFLYQELLSEFNFFETMIPFMSFEDAIQYMKESKTLGMNVVISDLNLVHLKAWDYLQIIEENNPELFSCYHFFICSCSTFHGDLTRIKSDPRVIDFLEKPIDFHYLESALQAKILSSQSR